MPGLLGTTKSKGLLGTPESKGLLGKKPKNPDNQTKKDIVKPIDNQSQLNNRSISGRPLNQQSGPTVFDATLNAVNKSINTVANSKVGKAIDKAGNVVHDELTKAANTNIGKTLLHKPSLVEVNQKLGNSSAALASGVADAATLGLTSLNQDQQTKDFNKKHSTAYGVGNLLGYTLPFGASEKLLNGAAKTLGKQTLKKEIAKGTIQGAVIGGTEGAIKGDSTTQNALNLALMGGAGNGILKSFDMLAPRPISEQKILTERQLKYPNDISRKSRTIVNARDPVRPIENVIEPQNTTNVVNASPNTKVLSNKVKGQELPNGEKLRSFPITAENSNLSPEFSNTINKETMSYKPISNSETWDAAIKSVQNDSTKAEDYFHQSAGHKQTAHDTALGEALIVDAIKKGDFQKANILTSELADRLTTAGQQIQAASIINRISPEGMLLYAQRQVNKANRLLEEANPLKKLKQKVELTPEESKYITETMQKIQNMEDGYARDVELSRVMQTIAKKIPKSLMQKVSDFQTVSMLSNPKTMIRNVVGNVLFGGAENVSQALSTGADWLISKKTGKRTTLMPNIMEQAKGLKEGFTRTINDAKLGVNTSPNATQFDLPSTPSFEKVPILNKAEKFVSTGLKLGDTPFYQAAYNDSLKMQMKLAKVSEPTTEMMEKATELAKYRTYQDVNKVTEMFTGLKNSFNKLGTKEFGLGDLILKFPKTPANILARAIDYSPASALNIMQKAMRGKLTQKQLVDALGRMATGTAIGYAGYEGAKHGVITGKANNDKDVAALEKQAGLTPYSIKLGNKNLTYDWAQPLSIPLAIGGNIAKNEKDAKGIGETILNSVAQGTNTLSEQTLMQGIKQALNGNQGISENFANVIAGMPASFVPSILKQIGQLTDDTVRNTYDKSWTKRNVVNPVINKIPGARKSLPEKVDTLGQNVKEYQGSNNIFNVLLNPGSLTSNKPTPAEKLVLDIYNNSPRGNKLKTQFPRIAPNVLSNGNALNDKQVQDLQREMGIETNELLTRLSQSESFTKLKPENQAKFIQKKLTEIEKKAKIKVLPKELLRKVVK